MPRAAATETTASTQNVRLWVSAAMPEARTMPWLIGLPRLLGLPRLPLATGAPEAPPLRSCVGPGLPVVRRRAVPDDPGRAQHVVVALGLTQAHRVRRGLHARLQRRDELFLGPDQAFPVVVGELVVVGHRERAGRACLDAEPAQDAAQVVDLVDPPVPLAGRLPLPLGVVPALDVDRVGRAGPGAELAADALLQAVWPAVQLVPAVEPGSGRLLLLRVLNGVDLPEHLPEGDAETLDGVEEV